MEDTLHRTQFEVKATAGRKFTGLASTWDLDYGGDVIQQGAYARTLKEWRDTGRNIPLIDQHNYGSGRAVVGRMIDAEETDEGLEATFEVVKSADGDEYLARVREGMLDGLSIGFEARQHRPPTDSEAKLGVARVLEDIELKEVSLVIWGMNPHALVNNIKAALPHIEDQKELRALASQIGSLLRPAPAKAADPAEEKEADPATTPECSADSQADPTEDVMSAAELAELQRQIKQTLGEIET
jgi:uncharacterized protein